MWTRSLLVVIKRPLTKYSASIACYFNLKSHLSWIQLFQRLFSLFILSGYQSPELNNWTSKCRQREGRGVGGLSLLVCPIPFCNSHQGIPETGHGAPWLSLYTEKPYHLAQCCRAICWCPVNACNITLEAFHLNLWRWDGVSINTNLTDFLESKHENISLAS